MIELTAKQKGFIARTRATLEKSKPLDNAASRRWDRKTREPVGMGKDGKIITAKP